MRQIQQVVTLAVLVAIVATARLTDHIPNVSPLTAVALTSGLLLPLPLAVATPIAASLAADITLGLAGLLTTASIYCSYALTALFGRLLRPRIRPLRGVGLALLSAGMFYLLTNAAVWWESGLYPHTAAGLLQSYYFALPFLRMSVLGDVAWSGVFFSGLAYGPVIVKRIGRWRWFSTVRELLGVWYNEDVTHS